MFSLTRSNRMVATRCHRCRHHMIVLMHGSHGSSNDFRYLTSLLEENSAPGDVSVFAPNEMSGWTTDKGTVYCGTRLNGLLDSYLASVAKDMLRRGQQVHSSLEISMSFVSHSFGGLVVREALHQFSKQLLKGPDGFYTRRVTIDGSTTVTASLRFGLFCTVASPHCGTCTMPSLVMRRTGMLIGRFASQSYADMFLLNDTLHRLASPDAIAALMSFQKLLFVSELRDALVPLGSSSLMPPIGCSHRHATPSPGWTEVVEEAACVLPNERRRDSDDSHGKWMKTYRMDTSKPQLPPECLGSSGEVRVQPWSLTAQLLQAEETIRRAIVSQFTRQSGNIFPTIESVVCDLQHSNRVLKESERSAAVRLGMKSATHRAIICKHPFYAPTAFGEVSEVILCALRGSV